jgi:uncharacterized protein
VSAPAGYLGAAAGGVVLRILVSPKASRDAIGTVQAEADGGSVLKVSVTAAPEAGKANAAVIKLLAKSWRLPKSGFTVRSGATGRRKTVFIDGDTEELLRHVRGRVETND